MLLRLPDLLLGVFIMVMSNHFPPSLKNMGKESQESGNNFVSFLFVCLSSMFWGKRERKRQRSKLKREEFCFEFYESSTLYF